jgi:hypothetical protein
MQSDQSTVVPATLAEAHEVLWRERPKRDAEPLVWVAFHRHSAEVYARVAKVDLQHRYEATQWAGIEIRRARDIEHGLNPEIDEDESEQTVEIHRGSRMEGGESL